MENNQQTPLEEQKEDVENKSFKCPSCGGNMTYDPVTSSLYCKYCETKKHIEEVQSFKEYDLSEGLATDSSWSTGKLVFHCNSCGADNVRDVNDITAHCPFCGSDAVIKTDQIPGIKPQRIIPFRISKNEALNKFKVRLKKNWFAPSDLKKNFTESKLTGLYLPSWTYDSHCLAQYDGELGEYYTVTVGSGKNRHTETRVRYFHISGTREFNFDDVLVTSGKALTDSEVDAILPYETNQSVEYKEEFIAGYEAEHYSVNLENGWAVAKQKTLSFMSHAIPNLYDHDVVSYINIYPVYDNIKYKYVLLPIWISYFEYHQKKYRFIVNGESGKISGKLPVSPLKVSILVGIILLLILIAFLIYYFVVRN